VFDINHASAMIFPKFAQRQKIRPARKEGLTKLREVKVMRNEERRKYDVIRLEEREKEREREREREKEREREGERERKRERRRLFTQDKRVDE